MARLTILPGTETDTDDPCTPDNTRPDPRPPTPPRPSTNTQHDNDTEQPEPRLQTLSTPTPKPPSTQPSTETTTYIARTDADLIAALHLISDSVAQQRQIAARALLTHPAYLSVLLLTIPYFYVEWYHDSSDWPLIIVIWVGVFMATLAVIKWVVRGYLDAAERVGRWSWLYGDQWIRNRFGRTMNLQSQQTRPKRTLSHTRIDGDPDFKTDFVFVTKLHDKIIAALVVRLENTWYLNPKPHQTQHPLKSTILHVKADRLQKKALIRAWTVERQYRGNGIGIALLRFVVRWCLDNEIEGPEFSESHAHSLRLLPETLNTGMDGAERRAKEKLYWEIQHYVEARGWQQFEERVMGRKTEGPGEKWSDACAGEGGLEVGEWVSPGPGVRGVLSPRKRVQMSRDVTREILKGSECGGVDLAMARGQNEGLRCRVDEAI